MSSRIEANRANAQHSAGPRTEAGKAASKYNATRHGLSGKQIVVVGEDPTAFDALHKDLIEAYKPANAAESTLVEEIAQNFWRLQRARRIESETFNIDGGGADPVIAFGCAGERMDQIRRYMTSIERAYHRAIAQLEKTQAIRAKASNGFVSQSAASNKLNDFELRPVGNVRRFPVRPANDVPVQLDSHPFRIDLQPVQQINDVQSARHGTRFAIYSNPDGLTPFLQRHTI
jgi:hypothetical protein